VSTVLPCTRCGVDMPPLPDDLAAMLRAGVAVNVTHEVCPGEAPPADTGRRFAVRVAIVEVTGEPDEAPAEEELAAFRATTVAADLEAAMRPLAEALGVEWMKVEKHARIADPRA
jgi:hypothetical protein